MYYLFINRDLLNSKLSLSNNTKLYKKFFDTKINKLDILEDKKDNKIFKIFYFIRATIRIVSFLTKYIYIFIFATIIIVVFAIFSLLTIDTICNSK